MLNGKRVILILGALCVAGAAALYYGPAQNNQHSGRDKGHDQAMNGTAANAALEDAAARSLRETQDQVRMMKDQQAQSDGQNQTSPR